MRNSIKLRIGSLLMTCIAITCGPQTLTSAEKSLPVVGDIAHDFELATLDGETVKLSKLTEEGPVVLVALRGFPGYQCPVCNAQVGQFLAKAKRFASTKSRIVLVYPGPAEGLEEHAEEFVRGKTLPKNVFLALDPDYGFANTYHLRWDAKNETVYPSTFIVDKDGKIKFAKVSKTHGDRASADEVLKALAE